MERKIKIYEQCLAICSNCRKIRDDSGISPGEGEWNILEQFMEQRAHIEMTHGLCPSCIEGLMRKPPGES